MAKTQNISELVSRAQKGDRKSLGILTAHVRRRVFVYLYRMTLDYHLAEDLVQETVLYMIESLPRLKTTSSLSIWAWIYRSAWGIFQHYVRPQGHQRIVQKTVVDHEALSSLTDSTEESALDHAERAELLEAICKSLGVMKTNHRNVLVLRCFELLSYAEIASIIGGSELHARVLFFHAKHALKRHLHNRGYGRQYFLTGLAMFGFVTGIHAKSASAAITVSSSLVKTGTVAATFAAIAAKLGLLKAVAVTIGLVVGTLWVCSSDADLAMEFTMSTVTGADESALSIAHGIGAVEIADYPLPDPCDSQPHKQEDIPPAEPGGTPRPGISASTAQADRLADPNETDM